MKRVVIVEDEMLAAKRLQKLLEASNSDFEIVAILDSVKNSAKWLANNEAPELLFMDIQLGDGLSFEIFDIVEVHSPVIFITAFNEYAIEAFKLNSIAYLLKPISEESLLGALDKYVEMTKLFNQSRQRQQVVELRASLKDGFKKRFMIKVGDHIKTVLTQEVAYFYSRDKATYLKTYEGRSYLLDYSLEQLAEMLDPLEYFRINRKYLVGLNAILDIVAFSNSRLAISIPNQDERDIIVSRERVSHFKEWLDR
jgi:DNA-binding LytR/AlgR family response regulator